MSAKESKEQSPREAENWGRVISQRLREGKSKQQQMLKRWSIIYEDQKSSISVNNKELINNSDQKSFSRIRRLKLKFENHGHLPERKLGIE